MEIVGIVIFNSLFFIFFILVICSYLELYFVFHLCVIHDMVELIRMKMVTREYCISFKRFFLWSVYKLGFQILLCLCSAYFVIIRTS